MSQLPEILRLTRNDLSNTLIHFTRRIDSQSAFDVLKTMITDKQIKGGPGYVRGGNANRCVCFTESPINEVSSYFNLETLLHDLQDSIRYEPYGIAFKKNYLFGQGARPVIYQPSAEYSLLPDELKYRHVTFDPVNKIDLTWEREWRLKQDSLNIDSNEAIVIVPTFEDAYELIQMIQEGETEYDVDRDGDGEYTAVPCGITYYCDWKIVSLELFGLE